VLKVRYEGVIGKIVGPEGFQGTEVYAKPAQACYGAISKLRSALVSSGFPPIEIRIGFENVTLLHLAHDRSNDVYFLSPGADLDEVRRRILTSSQEPDQASRTPLILSRHTYEDLHGLFALYVGPMAEVLLEEVWEKLGIPKTGPCPHCDIEVLLQAMTTHMPSEEAHEFVAKARKLLSDAGGRHGKQ